MLRNASAGDLLGPFEGLVRRDWWICGWLDSMLVGVWVGEGMSCTKVHTIHYCKRRDERLGPDDDLGTVLYVVGWDGMDMNGILWVKSKVSSVVDSREGAGGCGLLRMCLGTCILLRFISLCHCFFRPCLEYWYCEAAEVWRLHGYVPPQVYSTIRPL